jgi:hypothetical protein
MSKKAFAAELQKFIFLKDWLIDRRLRIPLLLKKASAKTCLECAAIHDDRWGIRT